MIVGILRTSVRAQLLESVFEHGAHSALRLLASAHQLLPRQQLCDSGDNQPLGHLVPPLLSRFSQQSDQSQHEKLVLIDPLAQLLPRLPPLLQEVLHFGAVLKHKQDHWPHIDVWLLRQGGVGDRVDIFGGVGGPHGRGGSSESHAGAGFGDVFLFLFGGELVAEVGLEAFGEISRLAVVVLLFVLEHLLDALLHQGAAVIIVHNFIIYLRLCETDHPIQPKSIDNEQQGRMLDKIVRSIVVGEYRISSYIIIATLFSIMYLQYLNLDMRQNFILLLLLTLPLLTHLQPADYLLDSATGFDSAQPTPVLNTDPSPPTPNLRIQNLQSPTGQNAALPSQQDYQQVPSQQAAQNVPQSPSPNVPQSPSPAGTPQQANPAQANTVAEQQANTVAEQPKILLNQINHPIVGKGFKVDNGVSYQRIKLGAIEEVKYLFFNFKLAEKDKWQSVNITISNEGSQQIINRCQYSGYDDCFIPAFALKNNSILFVHIQCQDDCAYNLNVQWSDTEHLIPGQQQIFMFGKDNHQIYHVELEEEEDFEEMRIHLAPRVTRKPFDNVKIYGKYGKDVAVSPQDFDFKSINLWEDGEGVFLKKSELKQKNFVLLIVGQAETTYRLSLKLVKEAEHEIQNGEHIYEYLKANSQRVYKVNSIPNIFGQYSLRFSVMSGDGLDIGYFKHKDLKEKVQYEPYEYMRDSEYVLNSELMDPTQHSLYLRVKTKDRDATYSVKFVGRKKADSIELNENIYGFIPVQKEGRFAHFDFKRWAEETDERATSLRFTVYMIEAAGKVTPQFAVCESTLNLCINPNFYKNTTVPITAKSAGSISEKKVYELEIDQKVLKKINIAEQQATIIVKLSAGKKSDGKQQPFNLVAIELLNNNKVLYLRQGRPLEEKMNEKEVKIYKYINSDPDVEEIRMHINSIAGQIVFNGFIQGTDPKNTIQVAAEGTTLRFTKNLTQPVYAQVIAQSKAIFGISMQVIHKSSVHKNVTVATISEDLTYTVKLQPNSYSIYEVVPIYNSFDFTYSSSQSIIVCAINPKTNACIDPDSPKVTPPNLGTRGSITKAELFNRKARIKMTNPFSDSIAEVTFIFHSREFDHCEVDKLIGQAYQLTVTDGKCVSFSIQEDKLIDLYVSKREFASLNYKVLLCGNALANASSKKTLEISTQVINKLCFERKENRKLSIVWSVATQNIDKRDSSVRVDLLAQYRGDFIVLTEGVSYNKITSVEDGLVGKFAYNLINKFDTKIILTQVRGNFKMFAKLVRRQFKNYDPITNINYRWVSSHTLDYSQAPIILISAEEARDADCVDCTLLIAVYTDIEKGFEAEYDIEVVQRYTTLNEDTAVEGYLDAGSYAYYTYNARQQEESTILVLLSDHNQQCANMYLSLLENPGPTTHIAKTEGENELIFRHPAGERKYYIAVEATKTCDYSLSVLTVDSSIHNLKRGKQNLIKFPAGVVKYFSLDHYTNEPFKIISLAKYGQINIYINQSKLSVDRKSFTTDQLALQKFKYKSEHKNTLTVDSNSPYFCQKCHYFIAIEALKATEATLYLVYPQTTVTLTDGHFLSDYLPKKYDYTIATYNRIEKTQISVRVYSGSLKVMAVYKDQMQSATFNAGDREQTLNIDFTKDYKDKHNPLPEADPNLGQPSTEVVVAVRERIPINIMLDAESDGVSYTLEMKSIGSGNINQLAVYHSLIPGEPNRISISNSKPICLNGYLREANQALILSANNDNRVFLSQLSMQAIVQGQNATITKTFTRNILGITLAKNGTASLNSGLGTPFELCLKLAVTAEKPQEPTASSVTEVDPTEEEPQTVFNATITQANTVNILESDTEAVVRGDSVFVINSEGQFLLDVFECKEEAKISFGASLENIQKSKLKGLDMVNMPDQRHAIKISQKQTTFVKVRSQHSIVRWMPIDYQTERGVGYIKFSSGDLRYSSKFKEIALEYQPLQQSKPTKAKVKEIKYMLYISNETGSIDLSSQCSTESPNVHVLELPSPALQKASEGAFLSKNIQKKDLEERFSGSENIYFRVVCELTLQVPALSEVKGSGRDEHEHYRFIYGRQQIPLQNYQQSQIESIPYHYLILLVVAIGAILILATYIFTRKCVPLIARLRNSNLVEQEPAQDHKDDLEVPASSDRNQRAPDIAVETQQKFGK